MFLGSRSDPDVCTATIDMMTKYGSRLFDQVFVRSEPIRWLVVGGTLLIAAIAIGSVLMAQNFRERALRTSEKLIEREETTIDTSERREEQRMNDDFVASRWTA